MTAAAQIQGIYRYPVKGLSAEQLASVVLATGQTLPADRAYAIENGPSGSTHRHLRTPQAAVPHADEERAARHAVHAV
jgi:Uncharacterized Fe-S protein